MLNSSVPQLSGWLLQAHASEHRALQRPATYSRAARCIGSRAPGALALQNAEKTELRYR